MGKYRAYPEYKSTGVEWFPDAPAGWGVLSARRVFKQVRDPASPDDAQLAATQKYGVIPQRLFMEYQDQKVVLALAGTGNFKHVEINDFVISLRSFQGGIERCHYEGCVSPAYTVMRRDKAIDPAYFSFLLKSQGFITALQSVTQGIREGKTITYEQFGSISVPFPTMGEQQHIAAFLDHETAKIDRLIAKQERLIELLKEKRQAVISHAVTKGLNPDAPMKDSGVEWLGEVPAHWVVAGFKKFLESVVDYRGKTPEKIDDGVLLVTARNIGNGKIDYTASQEFISPDQYEEVMRRGMPRIGDVLFVTEAPLGEVACVDREDIALAQRVIKFRGKAGLLDNYFLKYFIMSASFQSSLTKYATGSTALGIKAERLVYLRQLVPPLHEQQAIVEYVDVQLSRFDLLTQKARAAIELMREHRTALISAAVTGKIDVRGWQKPNNKPQEAATAASA